MILAAGVWSYWPAITLWVDAWNREQDYSHGWLVTPLAGVLLWLRRDSFPGLSRPSWITGGLLLALSVAMRWASARHYLEFLDGWSAIVWLAALTAMMGGGRLLWWASPALGFLIFMIPLPYGIERGLSLPLQTVATKLSCAQLQILGQPALSEGHVILLDDERLQVEEACSGLRLFVSILAVAYFYVVAVRSAWWERALLVLAALPIAVFTNSLRIVGTGLLYQLVSGEAAHTFAHDLAGYIMIGVAAGIFSLFLWYLGRLFPWEEELDVSSAVRQGV